VAKYVSGSATGSTVPKVPAPIPSTLPTPANDLIKAEASETRPPISSENTRAEAAGSAASKKQMVVDALVGEEDHLVLMDVEDQGNDALGTASEASAKIDASSGPGAISLIDNFDRITETLINHHGWTTRNARGGKRYLYPPGQSKGYHIDNLHLYLQEYFILSENATCRVATKETGFSSGGNKRGRQALVSSGQRNNEPQVKAGDCDESSFAAKQPSKRQRASKTPQGEKAAPRRSDSHREDKADDDMSPSASDQPLSHGKVTNTNAKATKKSSSSSVQAQGDTGIKAASEEDVEVNPQDYRGVKELLQYENFAYLWPSLKKIGWIWDHAPKTLNVEGGRIYYRLKHKFNNKNKGQFGRDHFFDEKAVMEFVENVVAGIHDDDESTIHTPESEGTASSPLKNGEENDVKPMAKGQSKSSLSSAFAKEATKGGKQSSRKKSNHEDKVLVTLEDIGVDKDQVLSAKDSDRRMWKKLKTHYGWTEHYENGRVYYLPAGGEIRRGLKGKGYFENLTAVRKFAMGNYQTVQEHILAYNKKHPKAPIDSPQSSVSSASSSEGEDEAIRNLTKLSYNDAWYQLKKFGWKAVKANGNALNNYDYVPPAPWGNVNGEKGVNYFTSEMQAADYVRQLLLEGRDFPKIDPEEAVEDGSEEEGEGEDDIESEDEEEEERKPAAKTATIKKGNQSGQSANAMSKPNQGAEEEDAIDPSYMTLTEDWPTLVKKLTEYWGWRSPDHPDLSSDVVLVPPTGDLNRNIRGLDYCVTAEDVFTVAMREGQAKDTDDTKKILEGLKAAGLELSHAEPSVEHCDDDDDAPMNENGSESMDHERNLEAASGSGKQEKQVRDWDCTEDFELWKDKIPPEERITGDEPFKHLTKKLRTCYGWTMAFPPKKDLTTNVMHYVVPGGKKKSKGGIEGIDYFAVNYDVDDGGHLLRREAIRRYRTKKPSAPKEARRAASIDHGKDLNVVEDYPIFQHMAQKNRATMNAATADSTTSSNDEIGGVHSSHEEPTEMEVEKLDEDEGKTGGEEDGSIDAMATDEGNEGEGAEEDSNSVEDGKNESSEQAGEHGDSTSKLSRKESVSPNIGKRSSSSPLADSYYDLEWLKTNPDPKDVMKVLTEGHGWKIGTHPLHNFTYRIPGKLDPRAPGAELNVDFFDKIYSVMEYIQAGNGLFSSKEEFEAFLQQQKDSPPVSNQASYLYYEQVRRLTLNVMLSLSFFFCRSQLVYSHRRRTQLP